MARLFVGIAVVLVAASCAPDADPAVDEVALSATTASGSPTAAPTSAAATTSPTAPPATVAWESVEIPGGVAAWNEVLVWTGDELVFWGGEDASSHSVPAGEPGMAYSPQDGTWRTIAVSPLPETVGATGVWTGAELVICCGSTGRSAAAYDPALDSWRELVPAPIAGTHAESVWTGSEMLAVATGRVAAYSPPTDSWRTFLEPPMPLGRLNRVAWTNSEFVVWPSDVERRVHRGMALNPATGEWRILPDPPAWPAVPDVVWAGDQLIVWGGLPAHRGLSEKAVGSSLDPASNVWTEMLEPLPEPHRFEGNLGSQAMLWTGSEVLVATGWFGTGVDSTGALLLTYDPADAVWSLVGPSPAGWRATAILAGDRVVFRSDRLYFIGPEWVSGGTPIPAEGLSPIGQSDGGS